MNDSSKLREAIVAGMKRACEDMVSFCDQPQVQFNAEYLFTVATAVAINKLNGPSADPYEIHIEHATKFLERDCLPLISRGRDPLKRGGSVFRPHHPIPKVSRKGRVDIAVYVDGSKAGYFGNKPHCVIELKGFNPGRKLILSDIRRNLEFHRLSGATGKSTLNLSFFGALHSKNPDQFEMNEGHIKKKYEGWLAELGPLPDIVAEIHTFNVSHDIHGRIFDEVDEQVIDNSSRHHFIGAIVSLTSLPRV